MRIAEENKKRAEEIFREIMTENFPQLTATQNYKSRKLKKYQAQEILENLHQGISYLNCKK